MQQIMDASNQMITLRSGALISIEVRKCNSCMLRECIMSDNLVKNLEKISYAVVVVVVAGAAFLDRFG